MRSDSPHPSCLPSLLPATPPQLARIPEHLQGLSKSYVTPGLARHKLVPGTSSLPFRPLAQQPVMPSLQAPSCLAQAVWGWTQVSNGHSLSTYFTGFMQTRTPQALQSFGVSPEIEHFLSLQYRLCPEHLLKGLCISHTLPHLKHSMP